MSIHHAQVPARRTGRGAPLGHPLAALRRLIQRIILERRYRRSERILRALSDRMLADVGLHRGEISARVRGLGGSESVPAPRARLLSLERPEVEKAHELDRAA
ncbi:MAG: DUF1127 domain-containing protein [Gammaproteobacteria bacterium]|nr:DUF1127 domain-containing protein [Gammaproteobacteria bacterium]